MTKPKLKPSATTRLSIEKYMSSVPVDTIIIATDGACKTNHIKANEASKAGWAAIVVYKTKDGNLNINANAGSITGCLATNQRAELLAITEGLKLVDSAEQILDTTDVIVLSDSQYSINCFKTWINGWISKGWKSSSNKPVKHVDIIQPTHELVRKLKADFQHVKGHSGHVLNELADKLAQKRAR
ncbi:Ribonuclease H [Vibrio stylophorae]|uniref:ribonuclease H n=1 Tax=Vibrio stylophorae TaxID=659351 RepID=A0ABM8ZR49_9VIBR|nr:ribonuclease H [Vibrio stylophorae]CAH0532782.1 Ribonuclease H [Vibrio stylophorae]